MLEHWQEGFRTVEDIFELIELSQKTPRAYMMANYYKTLSKILMVGENHVFHAAAFSTYFTIMRGNKNLPQSEFDSMASLCLVSALAIPITTTISVSEQDENTKNLRLTALLRSKKVPTREDLLKEALSFSAHISPDVLELYAILESQFHPRSICQKIAPLMQKFAADSNLAGYVKPLHSVVLTRLLKQLSQVYSNIKLETVVTLAAFPVPYNYTSADIEKFVVNGRKRGEFWISVLHATKSLAFETGVDGMPAIESLAKQVLLINTATSC
jgi:translation initiation factor 3 subunit A